MVQVSTDSISSSFCKSAAHRATREEEEEEEENDAEDEDGWTRVARALSEYD